jgi:hypothetical protein
MRVRLNDPELLADLCDYLSLQGCACQEVTEREAHVLMAGARTTFEAATMLLAQIRVWQATHEGVDVSLIPDTLL